MIKKHDNSSLVDDKKLVSKVSVNRTQFRSTEGLTDGKNYRSWTDLNRHSSFDEFRYFFMQRGIELMACNKRLKSLVGSVRSAKVFSVEDEAIDKSLLLISIYRANGVPELFVQRELKSSTTIHDLGIFRELLLPAMNGEQSFNQFLKIKKRTRQTTVFRNQTLLKVLLRAVELDMLLLNSETLARLEHFLTIAGVNSPQNEYTPLPDDFVTEFGKRAMWVLDNWLLPMTKLLKKTENVWKEQEAGRSPNYLLSSLARKCDSPGRFMNLMAPVLEHFNTPSNWFPLPPWELSQSVGKNKPRDGFFKPSTGDTLCINSLFCEEGLMVCYSGSLRELCNDKDVSLSHFFFSIRNQINIIQTSLVFMLGLMTGARQGELSSVPANNPSELILNPDGSQSHGLLHGTTYKLAVSEKGEKRIWVLPAELAQYLIQFNELRGQSTRFYNSLQADLRESIWITSGGDHSGNNVDGQVLSGWIKELSESFGISYSMDEVGFKIHRFRKTLARYVACAMNGGHYILYHAFGHLGWVMTQHYIEAEGMSKLMLQTNEELTRARAFLHGVKADAEVARKENVIEAYISLLQDKGKDYVGGGMKRIESMHVDFLAQAPKTRDIWLKQISEDGLAHQYVGKGIVCLKPSNARGECNKNSLKESIQAGDCKTFCEFHVRDKAMAYLQADQLIEDIQELDRIIANNEYNDGQWLIRQLANRIKKAGEDLKGMDMLPAAAMQYKIAKALIEAPLGKHMEAIGL